MLMDSPLNRSGLLRVFVHTQKNVLIEISPQTRIPRTFDRFCGLMSKQGLRGAVERARTRKSLLAHRNGLNKKRAW
jgi:rRNA small subunit pseudouridine methyltransferase Nep1